MKKFLNSPETILTQSLEGFVHAHRDIVALGEERKFVRRAQLQKRQGRARVRRRQRP